MKNLMILVLTLIVGTSNLNNLLAQPANEIGCFKQFDPNATGNNKTNAYLLSILNHYMNPSSVLGLDANHPRVVRIYHNNNAFKGVFERKVKHWFQSAKGTTTARPIAVGTPKNTTRRVNVSPVKFDFVHASDEEGIDPEAMIISTPKYIIVSWRGTDRVGNSTPLMGELHYRWGEWYKTNANARLVHAQGGSRSAKVHSGMNQSVLTILSSLAQKLEKYDVHRKKLWITGHSLGGASAKISAYYLKRLHDIDVHTVYAYGSPHVGNEQFVTEIERQLPGGRLQRFDFMSDPTTQVPIAEMGYFRAGIRNWYAKESGSGRRYYYNRSESNEFPSPLFCQHHTHWYARSAYFELVDNNPALRSKLPTAPDRPEDLCSFIDEGLVSGNSNLLVNLIGGNEDLAEGDYYIINAARPNDGYLSISSNLTDQNGSSASLRRVGSNSNILKSNHYEKFCFILRFYHRHVIQFQPFGTIRFSGYDPSLGQ